MKTDAALVSFMPASLRVKRQKQQQKGASVSSNNLPLPKKARLEPTVASAPTVAAIDNSNNSNNNSNSNGISSKQIGGVPKCTAVDDAYANFMSEINELGDF